MPYREIVVEGQAPPIINQIVGLGVVAEEVFATGSEEKRQEFEDILGRPVTALDLKVDEVQSLDRLEVAREKAFAAWEKNGRQPIIIEDTSLEFAAFDGKPGPYVKDVLGTLQDRSDWAKIAHERKDVRALMWVTFCLFDGKEFHVRQGVTTGTIAQTPRGGHFEFGFDDIFEPDGQEGIPGFEGRRTFAEMTLAEKNHPALSPRTKALLKLKEDPIKIGTWVYELPEPYQMQLDAIDRTLGFEPQARKHAYTLSVLDVADPREDLHVTKEDFRPYHLVNVGKGIQRIVVDPSSPDLGLIITPMETTRDIRGKPKRMLLDSNDRPIFRQIGPKSAEMALAARALEFQIHHNEETYANLRAMMRGKSVTPPRSNRRSEVIEELLKIRNGTVFEDMEDEWNLAFLNFARTGFFPRDEATFVLQAVAPQDFGYARQYTQRRFHRGEIARNGLFVTTSGIPTALFSLGGMPPVTGWTDVLTTSALSFMDSYIPRNSIYVDNIELQLKLFHAAKNRILSLGLPEDIAQLAIAHIGISLGSEDPKKMREYAKRMLQEGCSSARIYTTDPGPGVPRTAEYIREETDAMLQASEELRQTVGESFRICVAPIVDLTQAELLIGPNIRVNKLMSGHGTGENCTSLQGGGAASGIELAYRMSIDSAFNDTAIGLEGGTGTAFGALLGFLDTISMDRRMVEGGIETGGLFVDYVDGHVGQPYPGSASAITEWIEAEVNPNIRARRLDRAGRLKNVEGKPNKMVKHKIINSIVDNWLFLRMLASRALADQQSGSIADLRENIRKDGYTNHRGVTDYAKRLADEHRGS